MAARNGSLPWQWFDSEGAVLAGGKIFFYDPGTTDDKTTWKDSGKATAQANPVVLDSAGRFTIIPYTEGLYDVVIKTSADVTIDTWSNWGEEVTSSTDLSAISMIAGTGLSGGGNISANRTFNVDYATQAQQEAGSATDVAINPAVQHYHDSAVKVWAVFTVAGVVSDSFNVASVDDDGTGDFGVNLTTAFSAGNYSACVTPDSGGGTALMGVVDGKNVGSIEVKIFNDSGTLTDPGSQTNVIACGDQ